ncbi:MAG TPA: hypothetical protein VFV50_14450 [Bdellovibrionales bacterium]|nr:hypothetical protein [Bdellovibrionales bacterium]
MQNRLTQTWATEALYWLDRASDRGIFSPVHASARQFYLRVFTPALESYLRAHANGALLALEPRHSARSGRHFRIFRSDLDVTAVISESASNEDLRELLAAYAEAGRRFPFLGELEINTADELSAKRQALETHAALIEPVYWLRKWRYQTEALKTAPTRYHSAKASKALHALGRNLGVTGAAAAVSGRALGQALEHALEPLVTHVRGQAWWRSPLEPAYSYFLDWRLAGTSPGALALSPEASRVLACVLPDGLDIYPQEAARIDELRRAAPFFDAACALHIYELVICRSVERTREPLPEGHTDWVQRLESFITSNPLLSRRVSPRLFRYGDEGAEPGIAGS